MEEITAIECGSDFTITLLTNKDILISPQLKHLETSFIPEQINKNVESISCGISHVAALLTDSNLVVWGFNYSGVCNIPNIQGKVKKIICGGFHNTAILHNGTIICWGDETAVGDDADAVGNVAFVAVIGVVGILSIPFSVFLQVLFHIFIPNSFASLCLPAAASASYCSIITSVSDGTFLISGVFFGGGLPIGDLTGCLAAGFEAPAFPPPTPVETPSGY